MGRNYIAERTIADPRERAADKVRRKQAAARKRLAEKAADLAAGERIKKRMIQMGIEMKQPEDTKTIDLLQQKRGRGRPPVENPLTPAERAKRYREKSKAEGRSRRSIMAIIRDEPPVTNKDNDETFLLKLKIQQLENDLASYRKFDDQRRELDDMAQRQFDEIRSELKQSQRLVGDLTGALDEVVQVTAGGKRVPAHMLKGLMKLLADAR
jgi:hypothetical protein